MIRNILNSSVAATRFALKIAVNPSITLALYTQAMMKVPSKDGITTPLRKIIVKIIRSVKKPYNQWDIDRKSTRLNSSHVAISYAVFCLKKKKRQQQRSA